MSTPATAPSHPQLSVTLQGIRGVIGDLDRPCWIIAGPAGIGATSMPIADGGGYRALAAVGPLPPSRLGSSAFRRQHGVDEAYMAGAMANGIASEEMVIALARSGRLASFGAAGLLPDRIEAALHRFRRELPDRPYAVNLIHSPAELALERAAVDLFIRNELRCVEASAYLELTPQIVRYRLAGLVRQPDGRPGSLNRVIAKVSREELAERFMQPAPQQLVTQLRNEGLISAEQADLAGLVPMADDITVEADSGGHTDRRPLPALLPAVLRLRDRVQRERGWPELIRVGAAGGIGTPQAVWGAFASGADYVVTGSINQACVEAGASPATKQLLAAAGIADVAMAPAADMFEMGVELQVLRKGTMFPMRAKRLYELWREYDGVDGLPPAERRKLEEQIFRRPLAEVWADTEAYFASRDPDQLDRARGNEKRRMALIFRSYLGLSSRWSNIGEPDRVSDYQIWCGPAMGSFNSWARGSYLAAPEHRRVVDVAAQLMQGAAYSARISQLCLAGVGLPAELHDYVPQPPDTASDGGSS